MSQNAEAESALKVQPGSATQIYTPTVQIRRLRKEEEVTSKSAPEWEVAICFLPPRSYPSTTPSCHSTQ